MLTLHAKIGQPYALHLSDPAAVDFVPTAPTAVTAVVERPDGSRLSWTGSIVSQDTTQITTKFPIPVGMPDELGTWSWWVVYTIAGDTPGNRSDVQQFLVVAPDQPIIPVT